MAAMVRKDVVWHDGLRQLCLGQVCCGAVGCGKSRNGGEGLADYRRKNEL